MFYSVHISEMHGMASDLSGEICFTGASDWIIGTPSRGSLDVIPLAFCVCVCLVWDLLVGKQDFQFFY